MALEALGSGLAITHQMGQSIIMPQTLRLAGSRAVAHITSRDTPRPPLFRDDDGLAPLARDPGPVIHRARGGRSSRGENEV